VPEPESSTSVKRDDGENCSWHAQQQHQQHLAVKMGKSHERVSDSNVSISHLQLGPSTEQLRRNEIIMLESEFELEILAQVDISIQQNMYFTFKGFLIKEK
jgi:hypothetical protein